MRIFLTILALSLIIVICTIFRKTFVERQAVDPNYPPYGSAFVIAAGWPMAFIYDNPQKENFGALGFEDKFNLYTYSINVALFAVLAFLFWAT